MSLKVQKWVAPENQSYRDGDKEWSVARLFELSKTLPTMRVPLAHLCTWSRYNDLSLRDMVMHMRAVLDADLSHPIILDEDGVIMDGRHRLMKSMLLGKKSILVRRFEATPTPDRIISGS